MSNGQEEEAGPQTKKGMLDELENEIVLWYLSFKVREELYDIKGNDMDAVYVQRELEDTGIALCSEWAYIFLEGATFVNRMPSVKIMSVIMARMRRLLLKVMLLTVVLPWIPNCRYT
jgi:hypothetical protein